MTHAELVEVGPGIHAAIAQDDRGAVGNAAIVVLGADTLVVDTHFSPAAARELRDAAQEIAGRPVSHVLNTHWHSDHVLGNAQFSTATIVSTTRTRELMATLGAERLALQKASFDEGFAAELERLRAAGDEEGAALLERGADEQRAVTHRLPEETFEDAWQLGEARALTLGGGHTESDAFLLLPEARVLIAGDLVFAGLPPWVGHGDPREWAAILGRLLELDWNACVPGHGPVCGRETLASLRDYLLALDEAVRSAEPKPALPAPFREWGHDEMWGRNVSALRER